MITTRLRRLAIYLLVATTAGCGMLDVADPDAIEPADVNNGPAALMMRREVLYALYRSVPYLALYGGLMTDELLADPPTSSSTAGMHTYERFDRRWSAEIEAGVAETSTYPYTGFASTRYRATAAIGLLRAYASEAVRDAYVGQMYAVRGVVTTMLGENFCPGFPLNEEVDGRVVAGAPLTTEAVFEAALAEFDSALVYAADSARIVNFARVGQARALLGLGRFAEAAAAAQPVPTDYVINAEYLPGQGASNILRYSCCGTPTFSPADQDGGVGLDFVTANDPRVGHTFVGTGRDGVTDIYRAAKYPSSSAPIVLASGIEARLIEAEAALNGAGGDWLGIINELRGTAGLADTTDPGTPEARVDLLFRERAFWLYLTGHRLGDLRRLIAHYGRAAESAFPNGTYRRGGVYESGTSLPFPTALEARHNPAVTGCLAP